MKRKILLFLAGICVLSGLISGEVRVNEIEMEIPTYYTGPDDPNPPFWNLRVYPYPMQTDITRKKITKKYRVVVMENDYIKLFILPDVGGRILAAFDKTSNNFDFIYHNRVIKPGLVALRGAWLSGGIEWNFPTLGHTVNTFSPVNYKTIKHQDGSVTCVVGTEEWVRRMKWEVFISLFPERSYFKTRIRLFNRTLTHNNGYFWANAAAHAWEDTRIILPPAKYTYAGMRRNPKPWPVDGEKDDSWYKNTASAYDYFSGTPGDYNGSYNYEKDNGTVHYAFWYESPGRKFWTWGTAPSGAIWEGLLTDEDGQYIEIQAGRLLTQGDSWIFEPHLVEEWNEWWYPVKGMHGYVKANADAAVNLEVKDKGVLIALNTTRLFNDSGIKLYGDEELVFSEKLDISPERFYRKEIPLEESYRVYRLEFFDKNGQKVIDYTTEMPEIPPPELEPDFSIKKSNLAEIIFLKGYYSIKHWDMEAALHYFSEALKIDAEFTPALKWLGILQYKNGKIKEALELLEKVLQRMDDDYTARYYRALSKIKLGIKSRTEEDLHMVSRRAAYRHVAPYVLAALQIEKKNYKRARELLKSALRNNPDDQKAKIMLGAVERHLGHRKAAELLIDEVLKEDPIDLLALIEKMLLSGQNELQKLRDDPEYYLEAAADYAEMNFLDEALRTLEIHFAKAQGKEHPMLLYYLGYFQDKLGNKEEATEYFRKGAACSPDFVFPFRVETEDVLRMALKYYPSDWKAYYYLGNLLTAKLRWKEGFESFKKAAKFFPEFSVLYRNLGEIYWRKIKDYQKAEKMYEKALSFSPDDYRLYVALDELNAINKKDSKRERLYRSAPKKVKENFNYVLKKAQFYVDTGRYSQALKILQTHTFLPWEGWTGAREVFVLAHLMRAYSYMAQGKYEQAIEDLFQAMEFPENLGTGRPPDPQFVREYYFIGLCYENMGNKNQAGQYYSKAATAPAGFPSENTYFKALALRKIGKNKEAEKLLKELRKKSQVLIELTWRVKPQYCLWASRACYGLGNKSKAEEYLKKAVETDPSYRWLVLFVAERAIFN